MPRPSSVTVTELSSCMVTWTDVAVAGLGLVDRVVDQLEDHVVETRQVVGVADVHAWTLANSLQALEDFDVFGGVVRPRVRHLETSECRVLRIRPPTRIRSLRSIPQSTLGSNI